MTSCGRSSLITRTTSQSNLAVATVLVAVVLRSDLELLPTHIEYRQVSRVVHQGDLGGRARKTRVCQEKTEPVLAR
jgi:hypothetical protein